MIILLNIVCLILFLIAFAIAFLGVIVSAASSFKWGLLILLIAGGIYVVRMPVANYRDELVAQEKIENFLNEDKPEGYIYSEFKALSDTQKEITAKLIFQKKYSNNLESNIDYIKTYSSFNLNYVNSVRDSIDKIILDMFEAAEKDNTKNTWAKFSKNVKYDYIFNYGGETLREREFSKWNNEENAWNRVCLLQQDDVTYMFIKRFENSRYDFEAKKMILDNIAQRNGYMNITKSNGSTSVTIHNSSNTLINLNYKGTFAEGNLQIGGYGYQSISLPNGYYSFYVSGSGAHPESSREVLYGNPITKDYHIVFDRRR